MNKVSEIQVSYTSAETPKVKISTTEKAYRVLLENWDMNTIELCEEFKILCLNRANEVLGIYHHSKGGKSGTVVDQKLIFATALKCNASAIIVCHNHPSGNLTPSDSDIKLTKKLKKCGSFLEINVMDHLIISKNGYLSFINSGNM